MMRRLTWSLAALLALSDAAYAASPPTPPAISVLGGNVSIPATATTTHIAFPSNTTQYPVAQVINDGPVEAFLAFGSASIVATTSNLPLQAGRTLALWIPAGATNIAGVTVSGATTLRIIQWTGAPTYSGSSDTISAMVTGTVSTTGSLAVSPARANGSLTLASAATAQALLSAGTATHGCLIYNPASAAQEGIGAPESIFIDFTGNAAILGAGGSSQEIFPGSGWNCPSGMTTGISWIAATAGHLVTATAW